MGVYDNYGNPITSPGHVGNINPIRYRGYFYDSETGFYYLQSRYYDPEIGRFISMDTAKDRGAGILGNNLFIYAANSPLNNSDPNVRWIIKDAIKLGASIGMAVFQAVREVLSTVDGTYSTGINISASPGIFSFNAQCGIAIDTKGNIAFQGSFMGGFTGGSPGASVSLYRTVTNAPNIDKLEGTGYQIGGSAGIPVYGIPIAVGGDFVIIPDETENDVYFGNTINAGFGTPGGEGHVEWGETATWGKTRFNVFGLIDDIYKKISEW